MRTVLVTYIYPSVQVYLTALLDSLKNQTTDKFEIIFFNDGLINLENYLDVSGFGKPFHTYNLSGTIAEIRFESFQILSELNYDNVIFQDADDSMTKNRIEQIIKYLNFYQIVVNDIDLIDSEGKSIINNYWSNRLNHEATFNSNFLIDKNIAGLGNTAIKKELMTLPFNESYSVMALDWFFFYQLLKLSNTEGVFINSCRTLYRQHELNTAGLTQVNKKKIELAKKVKEIHYSELNRIGYNFDLQLRKLKKTKIVNKERINIKKHHFWWEETEYLQ